MVLYLTDISTSVHYVWQLNRKIPLRLLKSIKDCHKALIICSDIAAAEATVQLGLASKLEFFNLALNKVSKQMSVSLGQSLKLSYKMSRTAP